MKSERWKNKTLSRGHNQDQVGWEEEITVPFSSEIRQGCAGSSSLFEIIAYKMIDRIKILINGFCTENFIFSLLFYTDDGLL